jgi:protein O-mannosyl-transferase
VDKNKILACVIFLVMAVGLFYLPVLGNDFVNYDDRQTIVENPFIKSLDFASLKWMFTTNFQGYWVPLTWLSLALNVQMGGLNPDVFHLTNVFLHVLDTLLVFLVCLKVLGLARKPGAQQSPTLRYEDTKNDIKGKNEQENIGNKTIPQVYEIPTALITALLFGLHPIHVESVAWAWERKDVLYTLFYLSAILVYLDYVTGAGRKQIKLFACLGLYLLSLAAKPMAVTLPLVFLVLDFWPLARLRGNIKRVLIEKIPFFVLALLIALVTRVQMAQTQGINENLPFWLSASNAFHSMIFYLWKMAVPLNLSPFYPFPPVLDSLYYQKNLMAALLVALISLVCFYYRKKAPWLPAAWLYYFISLAPVLGFIQVGSYSAADRYTYLPSLGIFLPLSAGLVWLLSKRSWLLGMFYVALTLLLGITTVKQIEVWRNSETLWQRVVEAYPGANPNALTNLGALYLEKRQVDLALNLLKRAAVIPPPLAFTHDELGSALMFKNEVEEAVKEFRYALAIDPNYIQSHVNLWKVYEHMGKHEEAAEQMRLALEKAPNVAGNYTNLGVSCCFLKKYKEAEAAFQKALALEPDKLLNLVNLATVKAWQGRSDEALDLYRKAIVENPKEPVYFLRMADIFLDKKMKTQALECLRLASELNPRDVKTLKEMGEDYERAGRKDLAKACFEKVKALADSANPGVNDGR